MLTLLTLTVTVRVTLNLLTLPTLPTLLTLILDIALSNPRITEPSDYRYITDSSPVRSAYELHKGTIVIYNTAQHISDNLCTYPHSWNVYWLPAMSMWSLTTINWGDYDDRLYKSQLWADREHFKLCRTQPYHHLGRHCSSFRARQSTAIRGNCIIPLFRALLQFVSCSVRQRLATNCKQYEMYNGLSLHGKPIS